MSPTRRQRQHSEWNNSMTDPQPTIHFTDAHSLAMGWPIMPGKRYGDWELVDRVGRDIDTGGRDLHDVKGRLKGLLTELSTRSRRWRWRS